MTRESHVNAFHAYTYIPSAHRRLATTKRSLQLPASRPCTPETIQRTVDLKKFSGWPRLARNKSIPCLSNENFVVSKADQFSLALAPVPATLA